MKKVRKDSMSQPTKVDSTGEVFLLVTHTHHPHSIVSGPTPMGCCSFCDRKFRGGEDVWVQRTILAKPLEICQACMQDMKDIEHRREQNH